MDKKTSLLVWNQSPEFVRDEYPKFIAFVKAYYEFLENEQFVDGVSEKNNLIELLKRIRYISDVDKTLDLFEDNFYNTFLPLLPKDTYVDTDFLIKNVLPLYKSKGTEESVKYLFRLLFNEEATVEHPRNNILRASDGEWYVENIVRTTPTVYSLYQGNGSDTNYYLPYVFEPSNVLVYVDDVLKDLNTHYIFKRELKKISFNTAPVNGSTVKFVYLGNFDTTIFHSRKMTGQTSGAWTIIEEVGRRNISGKNLLQFSIDSKNVPSYYINGETIKIDVVVDGRTLNFYLESFSEIEKLNIVNPGSNYKVGDTLTFKGTSTTPPIAVVSEVSTGNIESLKVKVGSFGSGYKVGNNVWANNVVSNTFLSFIDSVDTTGYTSPNTISFNTNYISSLSGIRLDSPEYPFLSPDTIDIDSVIGDALSITTIEDLGPATNVFVAITDLKPSDNPTFVANSTIITGNVRIQDVGAIGSIQVNTSGVGYKVGDRIVFSNDYYFSGQGANATVSAVSPISGGILKVTVHDGGSNYSLEYPPILTIESEYGVDAQLSVKDLMGQGAQFEYDLGDGIQGKILNIDILNNGSGLISVPVVDLRKQGDGKAYVTAQTTPSLIALPGKWKTWDSILSSDYTKLQGEQFYIDFSYIVSSKVEFAKYKNIIKLLLNPSGAINYARYTISDEVSANISISAQTTFDRQLVGGATVNVVSGQAGVTGTNTYFEVANTLGIIHPGSYISVNSELMVVNSIINNTYLTVSEYYTNDANDTTISIMNEYDSMLTELWREINYEGNSKIYITTEGVTQ